MVYVYPGLKGEFKFKSPVSEKVPKMVYIVTSIRSIKELEDSIEKPLETIYAPIGLNKVHMEEDIKNKIDIIVLTDPTGVNYTYVPLDMISEAPKVDGVPYADRMLAVNLGKLPVDLDLSNVMDIIKDKILTITNMKVDVAVLNTSGVELVDEVDHELYMRKIEHGGQREESFESKYKKLEKVHKTLIKHTELINKGLYIKTQNGDITVSTEDP